MVLAALGMMLGAAQAAPRTPREVFAASLVRLTRLVAPSTNTTPQTLVGTVRVTEARGIAEALVGQHLEFAFQAPDRARLSFQIDGRPLVMGRRANTLWILAPEKRFGVVGSADVPRFLGRPDTIEKTRLPPFRLPLNPRRLLLLPMLMEVTPLANQTIDGEECVGLQLRPRSPARAMLKLPPGTLRLWIRRSDLLPARVRWQDAHHRVLTLAVTPRLEPPWPAAAWDPRPPPGTRLEKVALAHLARFFPAALSLLDIHLPSLGPATGSRRVVARCGKGRLEIRDGTRVLFLKGTPEEMGRQQGELMKPQVRDLVEKVLYGVGVASSFEKGRWFFDEIEECQARIEPFVNPRHLREMDALAVAAGLHPQEARLANFFPELFHCSGFAVWGQATKDGRLYHGRVLDYLRGVGLEANAVVTVCRPDRGFAWVNVTYAGFIGSVTAMNEKGISLGEMGGKGNGHWDGKPMAQLVRDVMERADSLEAGLDLMRRGPRTCEYFYVLADGRQRRAVGIAATPERFEVVEAGQAHPRLPHAVPDAVLLSAGDRYEKLVARVIHHYGRLDAEGARRLMDRPVAMTSNIHCALFAPETLDFWVANADAKRPAAHTRYTHYNLKELLQPERQESRQPSRQ